MIVRVNGCVEGGGKLWQYERVEWSEAGAFGYRRSKVLPWTDDISRHHGSNDNIFPSLSQRSTVDSAASNLTVF